MKLHRNAALSWSGRRLLAGRVLECGWTLTAAAEAAGVSVRCARKWVGRYREEGEAGLADRSSAPRRVANRTPADRVAVIVALRQLRMTAAEIAETVSAVLNRQGIGRLGRCWASSRLSATSARGQGSSYTSMSRSSDGSRSQANASATAQRVRADPGSGTPTVTTAA